MNQDELVAAVESAIGALSQVYRNGADESDLYEAALLTIAIAAAEGAGGARLLTNDGNSQADAVTFRRGPGHLWSPNFTYALMSFPPSTKQLEIHLGVLVSGVSGVPHECDVALIDSAECDRSRAGGVHPRRTSLVAALEAKHYHASPGLGVGRGFLGLAHELGSKRCYLAFPAQASTSITMLIAGKESECIPDLVPSGAAASRLQSLLEQKIRNWLR